MFLFLTGLASILNQRAEVLADVRSHDGLPFFRANVCFHFQRCGVIRERARSVAADLHPLSVSFPPHSR